MADATGYIEALRLAVDRINFVQELAEDPIAVRGTSLTKLSQYLKSAIKSVDSVAEFAPQEVRAAMVRQATDFRRSSEKLLLYRKVGQTLSSSPAQYVDGLVDFCTAVFVQSRELQANLRKELVRAPKRPSGLSKDISREGKSSRVSQRIDGGWREVM